MAQRTGRFLPWSDFRRKVVFEQGEHVGMIGPTGRGKSTLAFHLIKRRPYVIVLDAKGGDATLQASGFEVVHEWPIPDLAERVRKGQPIRVMLRPSSHGRTRLDEAHDLFGRCIEDALRQTNWTIYIDELRLTSEGRTIDLAPEIEVGYMTGRGRKVSFISASQAPRWVPIASHEQSVHQFHWRLHDRYAWNRQAEISGIGRDRFDELTSGMGRHEVLYVRPPDTAIITKPPALRAPKPPEPRESEREPNKPVQRSSKLRQRLWGKD